ncbi:MAG TPA: pyridoxal-dependent decarboxylase [Gemmatimonadaceae bacterium]|nr:pyridoxal-dependent decarboxylase [Gemmatimonadaceae bacterium]
MTSPLDLDHETMRRLGHRVADVVAEHLAGLREQPVIATASRTEMEAIVASPAPITGIDFETLMQLLREKVFPYAAREPHPGFIAYVPSCPTFPAVLGDWLATGFNFFAGVWPVASGPNMLELSVLDWFRDWVGMPAGSSGLLTSGGSVATLTAMIAARHAVVGEDPTRMARLALYTSSQAHSSVERAAWIAGIPRAHVRLVPVDNGYRLVPGALARAIRRDRAEGLLPVAVVANAGTTNTGAVDPLHDVADICRAEDVWMHIDAAYAGFSVLTRRGREALDGIGRADSITLDPHKWLYVPFECGCLLARDPHRLRDAFAIFPDYLKDVQAAGEQVNFADYGEQLTRYSRALKVWLSVSYFGTNAIAATIDRTMDLAAYAERLVRAEPSLEVLASAQFGILCFRAHPDGLDDAASLDALNERINAAVNAGGRHFISSTRLNGTFSLRICILGYRTAEEDVASLVRSVVGLARGEG